MPRPAQARIVLPPPPLAGGAMGDRGLDYLRRLLLDGGLEPGQPVPIDAIAARLGMSRQPIALATKRLADEGFIVVRPQAGSWVATPDARGVADFYGLFAPAEAYVVRLAADRRDVGEARRFAATVAAIHAEARLAGPPGAHDPAYRMLNRRFHDAIHAMARAPDVAALVAGLWDRSDFYIRVAFGSLFFDDATLEAQCAIADAIAVGDGEAAHAATARHLARVGASVAERLARDAATPAG